MKLSQFTVILSSLSLLAACGSTPVESPAPVAQTAENEMMQAPADEYSAPIEDTKPALKIEKKKKKKGKKKNRRS